MEANLARMKELLVDYPNILVRPHAKTHKCVEIAKIQESAFGSQFS